MVIEEERQVLIPHDLDYEDLASVAGSSWSTLLIEGVTMGSYWKLHILVEAGKEAESEAIRREVSSVFEMVVEQMSHWDDRSDISRLSRSAPDVAHVVPAELFEVLEAAMEIARSSEGKYDPTLGDVVSEFGFGPELAGEILREGQRDWRSVRLDAELKSVTHEGGVMFDLSSIAKGYAIDVACEKLRESGYRHFLLEIGGEFRGSGCKASGEPWWVEISPEGESEKHAETLVAVCGVAVATSGVSVQSRYEDGVFIHHLMSAGERKPMDGVLRSVTVINETCMQADAWATALFLMGAEDGLKMAEEKKLAALFVLNDGRVLNSSAYDELVED